MICLRNGHYLDPLAVNDELLIFSGYEDRDDGVALYAIPLEEDAELWELDDDFDEEHRVMNAFFTADGRDIIYTVRDAIYLRHDDVEVRQVPVDGETSPDRIFDEVELLDVQWETPRLQYIFSYIP
jgi:hypothetical protein